MWHFYQEFNSKTHIFKFTSTVEYFTSLMATRLLSQLSLVNINYCLTEPKVMALNVSPTQIYFQSTLHTMMQCNWLYYSY